MEAYHADPVHEGFGIGAIKVAYKMSDFVFLAALFVSAVSWHFAFCYWIGSLGLAGIAKGISVSKVTEIMANPKVHDYIESKCKEIWNRVSKDYPDLQEYTSNVKLTFYDQVRAGKRAAGPIRNITNYTFISKQLHNPTYKHTVVIFGDATHIDDLYVIFRDKKANEYIAVPIPAPRQSDLKALIHKD